jgi:predicted dehydrogenase
MYTIPEVIVPSQPVDVALIGTGQRSRTIYAPLFGSLAPWMRLVAVCDPVRDNADALAAQLGVPAFYDIFELVRARPMEAALVVTPIPSLHSISVYLSSHGVHSLTETPWCSMVAQARQMIEVAQQHKVVIRVAENFFRFPIDRIVAEIRKTNLLGPIHRVVSYNDHTGYHNNSRWIVLAGAHPQAVQAIEHDIPTAAFGSSPRYHDHETYRAHFIAFPGNLLVVDHASNVKGFLGRHSRPGYTEWQGERGTIVYAAKNGWNGEGEVRYCSDKALSTGHGAHDQTFTIVNEVENGGWTRTYVDLSSGRAEYVNPFRPAQLSQHFLPYYSAPIMGHVVDFILAIRGLQRSEFDEEDALMSLMMEAGTRESVLNGGVMIPLPLEGDLASDQLARNALQAQFGVDPMDIEAMLSISYPKA